MDSLSQKAFTTSRGFTYNYYISPPSANISPNTPALLLQHGWPMNAHLWDLVVPKLTPLPFRVVVVDMLGAGETSKPEDVAAYSGKSVAHDFAELLDSEGLTNLILIAHDFGSWFMQRFYLFFPNRVLAMVLLSVGYMPPMPAPVDLETFLAATEQAAGYAQYDYFRFFLSDDGPHVLREKIDSLFTLLFGARRGMAREYYTMPGAFEKYLLSDARTPVKPFAEEPDFKEKWAGPLLKYGFEGGLNWYRAVVGGVQYEAEKELSPEQCVIKVPVLFMPCKDDAVARKENIDPVVAAGLLPDLKIVELDCAHYCPLEKPDEVSSEIIGFLKAKSLLE